MLLKLILNPIFSCKLKVHAFHFSREFNSFCRLIVTLKTCKVNMLWGVTKKQLSSHVICEFHTYNCNVVVMCKFVDVFNEFKHHSYLDILLSFFFLCIGAKHIVQVGLGDDDQGIEDDFSAWYVVSANFYACHPNFNVGYCYFLVFYFFSLLPIIISLLLCGIWNINCTFRRELLWPELDKLLQDENETCASTPYIAAIPEYQVVFVKPEEVPYLDKSLSFANGHAIHDIQHPCR